MSRYHLSDLSGEERAQIGDVVFRELRKAGGLEPPSYALLQWMTEIALLAPAALDEVLNKRSVKGDAK